MDILLKVRNPKIHQSFLNPISGFRLTNICIKFSKFVINVDIETFLLLTFCLQLIFIFNSLLPLQEINFKVVYVTIKADPLNFKGHATFYWGTLEIQHLYCLYMNRKERLPFFISWIHVSWIAYNERYLIIMFNVFLIFRVIYKLLLWYILKS